MSKIFELLEKEQERQRCTISLIASENIVYPEVLRLEGSCLVNKYAEGYPGKRYYQGNKIMDEIEVLAIENTKKVFGLAHANVQPYSGSPANSAVLMALCQPGDTIMGLRLSAGGHLTHGHPEVSFSGRFFKSIQFDVDKEGRIDYGEVEKLVDQTRPKVIFFGTTSYPYTLDFEQMGRIADKVGAYLVADISHIAGLVATGLHPDPVPHVHLVTTTTHKMLRGPRGAIIGVTQKGLGKDPELAKKIDRAIFPGMQGGPHMSTIAGIAYTMERAGGQDYKEYCAQILKNSKALYEELKKAGLKVWGGENHLMVVDCGFERGREVAVKLEEVGLIVNANNIPHDLAKPFKPSGIRIGTPAATSMGLVETDMVAIAKKIINVILA